jgi:hypothetical protein
MTAGWRAALMGAGMALQKRNAHKSYRGGLPMCRSTITQDRSLKDGITQAKRRKIGSCESRKKMMRHKIAKTTINHSVASLFKGTLTLLPVFALRP